MAPPDEDDLIADYVARALDARDSGATIDPDRLCADHPHLADAVAEALGIVAALPAMHLDASRADRWIGQCLGDRYELEERLGAGAMGAVYRARDRELQRDVAVKVLRHDLFGGEAAEQRFLREAEVLAAVDHAHVVPVYDRGRSEDGTLFLVMACVPGMSLAVILEWARESLPDASAASFASIGWLQERLPAARLESSYLRQCARWCAEIAAGLEAAHARGVVHRDVKPSNVLITASGRAVLVDFGIAARHGDGMLTATGTSIGTPWYMAPEQAAGAHEPDPRADVYSLGATFYHLCGLRPPFDDDPMRVLARVQLEDPPRLARIHRGLPRDLQAIVEAAMERDPRRRFASAGSLQRDCEAFLEHRAVSVRPLGPIGRALRATRRHPARAIAGVALVAALGVVPLWMQRAEARAYAEHARRSAALPALLSLEGAPGQRSLIGDEERTQVLDELDRLLELRPDDLASRVLKIAVLEDMGARSAAGGEAAALAEFGGTRYLSELVARYRAGSGALHDLDPATLPEPVAEIDAFVAGFFALRARTPASLRAAVELLDRAAAYPPARDLRLIAWLATGHYEEAHDDALRLEGVYGRPTARTRHVVGACLLAWGQWDDAIDAIEQARALRPGRHGSLQNLGVAYARLGYANHARSLFEEAHRIRPWLWNTPLELARLELDLGNYEPALEWASKIPDDNPLGAWLRPLTIAQYLLEQAADVRGAGETERAVELAERSLAQYRAAQSIGLPDSRAAPVAIEMRFLEAVIARNDLGRFERFLEIAAADPLRPAVLRHLSQLMPVEGLSPEQSLLLRQLLQVQAEKLAPGRR